MIVIPPVANERKPHPARFWRDQKLGRHVTRGGLGVVGRLRKKGRK